MDMGTWDTTIFGNDTAADLKSEVRDRLADGAMPSQLVADLVEEYGVDDAPDHNNPDHNDFWLAVALALHKYGYVVEAVRSRALHIIDSQEELERWEPSDRTKRAKALADAKGQLLGPVPPTKKLRPRTKVSTALAAGDHVRYAFDVHGHEVLLRVTNIHEDKGGRMPTVEVLVWDGSEGQAPRANRLPVVVHLFGGHPEPFRLLLVGEPGDPAGLVVLPVKSDRRTAAPLQGSGGIVSKWSEIAQYFGHDGLPQNTVAVEQPNWLVRFVASRLHLLLKRRT